MDNRTRKVPPRSNPSNAGTKHLGLGLVAEADERGAAAVEQHEVAVLQAVAAGAVEGVPQAVFLAHGGLRAGLARRADIAEGQRLAGGDFRAEISTEAHPA